MESFPFWAILLLSTSCVTSIPTAELTTRRYNSYNGYSKILVNNQKLDKKNSNSTKNTSHVNQNFVNKKHKINSNLKSRNETELIHGFIKNNIEDLRFPNKTLKIKKLSKPKVSSGSKQPIKLTVGKIKQTNKKVHQTISFSSKKPIGSNNKLQENLSKEDWSNYNIPIPNPNPIVSSYSPQYPVGTLPPGNSNGVISGDDDSIVVMPSESGNLLTQSLFNVNGNAGEKLNSNCPTVHLTNSVLGASAKQGCSDLSIAINTHIHQNPVPERLPSSAGEILETADSGTSGLVAVPPELEAASAPLGAAAADPIGSVVGGGTPAGGGGPLSGLPSLPEFPQFPKLPDLKHMLDFLKFIGPGLAVVKEALKALSPLVYIVPIASFIIGFATILPFYPWWLPFLFLFGKEKKPPKTEIIYHKHVHKPLHHLDGWFWNHNMKTWTNIAHHVHARSNLFPYDDFVS